MDPSSEGGRMTWHDVAKRRTLLDFSSMNDFGEDVVTSSSVEYGRFQLGLFLSGVFIIALYVYAEFLHYMRIKRMHNSSYNKGLAEDSIEMRMAGTKRFDVLLEGGNKSAPDVSLSSSMQGMNDEDKKRSFANFTDSFGRNNSQSGNMSDTGATASSAAMDNSNVKFTHISAMRILQGDADAIERARLVLRSWAELFFILFVFYVCDRTSAFPERTKSYSRDFFIAIFITLATYGCYQTLRQSKTNAPLNREQTEEWKGWMQVLFLLYHYFKASEIYNAIRIFIAAYVWMTGFGNFSYYHVRKDFSVGRFSQMMWRLNFFVLFVCIALRNDYVLYYICPMHTLFTLFVYFSLLIFKEHNTSTNIVTAKILILIVLVYVIWEVPGVFTILFKPFEWLLSYTDPKKPDANPMHEWFFRSGLDRYVWIYGMVCAFLHPKYEAFVRWVDEKPTKEKTVIQALILTTNTIVGYWWYRTYYILPKLEYNVVHPYTSWIPITIFIIFRNFSLTMRSYFIHIFCECGKITLETYISQFHIWLSSSVPNGQPGMLLGLLPEEYPVLNFMLCTTIYVGISQRIFTLTNDLKLACVPSANNKLLSLHVGFGVAWFIGMGIAGSALLMAV
jgi:hypothetical protein|mmetsp:Transcript_208/g.581  ORF Transcript_208/g.581 Transcript_208/m.581 type:complete len:618 (-) Transcript_208:1254-3107(-)